MGVEQLELNAPHRLSGQEMGFEELQTALKQCESDARDAQERESWLRMVIDTANDAFVSTNVMGEILEWNSQAEQLFGWTHKEVIGKRLTDNIFPSDVSGRGTGGLQYLVQVKNEGKRLETKACTRDGKEMSVEVSIAPMRMGSSFVLNAFIHDITERKMLQAKIAHSHKLESVGQLSAGIAHEINTPIQYVGDNTRFLEQSFSDLLSVLQAYDQLTEAIRGQHDTRASLERVEQIADEVDLNFLKEEIGRAIAESLDGTERVASIVRAMKEFSHPGSVTKTPTDLNKGIANTITVATNEWKYVADIETEFDPELPLVPCLPGDLNQVVLNLIINGAQAIKELLGDCPDEKGTIAIRTSRSETHAEICVSDTGSGVPESVRDRIFDPFFTTKDVGVGSGQGLAIARSVVVEKHGGTLELLPSKGTGATFLIRIPLV